MRRLHRKVNIVPVLAKADTLTAAEVVKLKRQVLADIEENKIQIYQFPECDSDEDEEFKAQDRELKACIPFAVVGSNTVLEVGGRKVRGRQYPWGVVEGKTKPLENKPTLKGKSNWESLNPLNIQGNRTRRFYYEWVVIFFRKSVRKHLLTGSALIFFRDFKLESGHFWGQPTWLS